MGYVKLREGSWTALLCSGVQVGPGEDLGICCSDGTQDVYPHHPEDLDMDWSVQYSTVQYSTVQYSTVQ